MLRGMSLSTPVSQITLNSNISHVGWLKGARQISSSASYKQKGTQHLKTTNSLFRRYLRQKPMFSAPAYTTADNSMKLTSNFQETTNFYNVRHDDSEIPFAFKFSDGSVGRLQMCDSDVLRLSIAKGALHNKLSSKSDKISPTFGSDRLHKLLKIDTDKK